MKNMKLLHTLSLCALLLLGAFTTSVWGRTSSVNTAALWKSSTYSTGDSVVWTAPNVTFKLHNGGNIELYMNDHILIQKNQHYTLEWRVANGYTINVTQVSVRARSTEEAYITVGEGDKSDNIFASYTTVYSQSLSLGNTGNVDIYPEGDNEAIIHMDEITVTYTIQGVAKEVTIDSWLDFTDKKNESTILGKGASGPFVKTAADGATFTLSGGDVRKWCASKESDTHFYLSDGSTATLSWTQPTGYTVLVEGIEINAFTARSNGKLYIWSNNNNSDHEFKVITENESNNTNSDGLIKTYVYNTKYNDTKGVSAYLFPSGNKMGVSDNFKLKPTSREGRINWINLTYTINPNSYDITLDNETPTTSGSTSVTVTYDSNSQLSITNPEKDGYTFDGWYTTETAGNGSGTKVIDVDGNLQANITVGATVYTGADGIWKKTTATTLYAKWILNGIKDIMLEDQGATTAGTDSLSVRFMTDHYSKASITAPAKTGYTFDGYYSASSGGVQVIDAEGNVVADVEGYTDSDKKWINGDDETTLYAHWTGVSYSVRFNGNGSTDGSMSNQAFVYGTAQSLTTIGFEKTCTVTYNTNGGSCGIASSTTPFPFLGWATSEGGDVVYANGASVNNLTTTSGATVDLYAKWAASPSAVELPTPTKENGVFTGWYNADEDSIGNAGDSYTPSGNETLYAHWKPGVSMTISNLSGGDLVVTTEHVRFTLHSDGYNITDYKDGYGFYVWEPLPKNTTKDVTLSWEKTIENGSYSINVTNISFKAKAYNSDAFIVSKGKISFNGGDAFSIGTATLTTDGGWSSTIGGEGDYESGVVIQLINTSGVAWETFDYHFKDFQIEYTITPNAPTADDTDLAATLDLEDKQKVAVSSLFSLTNPAADFVYAYRLKEDYANAHIEDGYFWATEGGDYEVQACVASGEDHEASVWSTATIHVTRTCVFHNTTGDKNWETTGNWAHSATPTAGDAVRVQGNLTIDEQIEMQSLSIEGAAVVEIAPTGGLTVGAGGISGATAENLILKAGTEGATKGQTGYLRISPEFAGSMPQATVELYSTVYYNSALSGDGAATYQCLGAPIEGVLAKTVFPAGSYLFTWDEEEEKWTNNRAKLTFEAFKGYEITQKKATAGYGFEYAGQLVSVKDSKTIDLDYTSEAKGYNLLANSWTAPIDIANFESDDFTNATQTIYILNAGTKANSDDPGASVDAAGKWIGMPIATVSTLAESGYPRMIAPMQGFWIKATGASAQLTLDYSRLVWGVDYSGYKENKPLRAPKRNAEMEEKPVIGKLKVSLYSENESDFFFMLESEQYETVYEDGYDAKKIPSGSMDIFAVEGDEELGVDATNSIIGTRVGVRTSAETAYTLSFNYVSDEEWALYDAETENTIDINEGMEYTFFAEPNTEITERFMIVERADAPNVTTGVDNTQSDVKASKFIKDGQLFILKNGVLYDATGARVR